MCVFRKVIYIREWKMKAGLPVVVEKVTRGHLKYNGDLTKNFDQVCVCYH